MKHSQWQTRLAELRKSLPGDSDNSSTFAWIWLSGIVSMTILFVAILSPGRFVNIEKANQHLENASFAIDNNDTETAIGELEQAIVVWPETVRGHTTLGLAYFGQEDYDLALTEGETALDLDPNSVIANLLMGFVNSYQLEFSQAIENLKIVAASQPNWATPHAYLALLYFQSDQTELTERELEIALAYEEGDGQASLLIGAYYFGVQNYPEAEKHFLKAAQLPTATSGDYFWLARLYEAEGKFDLAEDALNTAGSLDTTEVDMHLARADLFLFRENLAGAASEIADALKSAPDNSEAHSDLSYIYYLQGRIDEAATEAELAITANPYNAQAYIEQAFAYHAQGKLAEALSAAQKASVSAPKTDRGHYILGLCYMDRGMKDDAINEFEEFLELYWERAYGEQYKESAEGYLVELRK